MKLIVFSFWGCLAHFLVQKVTPQTDGSSSKVKVKVRVNIHGIFSVSSASLVEVHKSDENEEPMETDQHAKEEEVMDFAVGYLEDMIKHSWSGSGKFLETRRI